MANYRVANVRDELKEGEGTSPKYPGAGDTFASSNPGYGDPDLNRGPPRDHDRDRGPPPDEDDLFDDHASGVAASRELIAQRAAFS